MSLIVHSIGHSFDAFAGSNLSEIKVSPTLVSESKLNSDFLTSSTSEISNNHSRLNICQKELNFDELTFKKVKFQSNLIVTSAAVHPFALKALSDVVAVIPTYSYFESYYFCWYILYQVFRI